MLEKKSYNFRQIDHSVSIFIFKSTLEKKYFQVVNANLYLLYKINKSKCIDRQDMSSVYKKHFIIENLRLVGIIIMT